MWTNDKIDEAANELVRGPSLMVPITEVGPLLRQMRDEYELRLSALSTGLDECLAEAQPALDLVALLLKSGSNYLSICDYQLWHDIFVGEWRVTHHGHISVYEGTLSGAIAALKEATGDTNG